MGVAAVLGAGISFYVAKQQANHRVVSQAELVGQSAGCTDVVDQPDQGRTHLSPAEAHQYSEHPATSGPHDPSPLPGNVHVYTSPVPETRAVHNLEHGYVLLYYRPAGDTALPASLIDTLAQLARGEDKVILAPYPQLAGGQALALAAWDELQHCPSSLSAQQATSLVLAFVTRFRGGGKAPESGAP